MRIYTQEDFEQVLNALPNDPANHAVYNMLMAMRDESRVIKQPYTYEVDFSTGAGLLAGAFAAPGVGVAVQGNFLVDSSAPFMLVAQAYRADLAGAAQTSGAQISPNNTVFIVDQSGNRQWMNGPVPVTAIFGTGERPWFLPQPRLIPANTNVQVQLANYEAANTNNIRLAFIGYRYYAVGQ